MLKKRKIKHIFIKLICKFYKNSFFNKIKMSCPNSNKNVIETFHKLGLLDTNLSPEDEASQRRRLYYTVCITFRLFLAGLLFQLRNKKSMQILVAILSGLTVLNYIFFKKKGDEWWNIYFSLAIYILLFITSLFILLGVKITTYALPCIFFFSIFAGIFKSMTKPSC